MAPDVKDRFLKAPGPWGGAPRCARCDPKWKEAGVKFHLAYFRPASRLNAALQRLYEGTIFSVVRQLKYSEHFRKNAESSW